MSRRWGVLVAAVLALAVTGTACGAAGEANPRKVGPRGVDELVIPTPDPDPDDFVDGVDNPWLPLEPGTVWTYDAPGEVGETVEVRVEDDTETVAGVECVVVVTNVVDPASVAVGIRRFYAQDREGNVWLFGEQPSAAGVEAGRSWLAGEDGAEAGVAMLATPRVGDGYLHQDAGDVADRSTVLALDEERTVPAGTFAGLLVTEDTVTTDDGELVVRRYYAEGTGLVEDGYGRGLVLRSVVTS